MICKAIDFVEKRRTTVLLVVIALLILVFLFMEDGYSWIMRKMGSKEGFVATTQDNTLYVFYVDWCPHCVSAKPQVEQLKKDMANDTIAKEKVTVQLINAEKDEELAKKFKVAGYPTIIFVRRGKEYTYEGARTADAIKAFMEEKIKSA